MMKELKKVILKEPLHQTEFLMYDTNNQLSEQHQHSAVISPFFFAPLLFQQSALQSSGFYTLLQTSSS